MRIYLYRFLFFGMIIIPSLAWTQPNTEVVPEKLAHNELKINMPYLLFLGPEVVYERIITNSLSVGFSTFVYLYEPPTTVAYTIYNRAFFGEGRASGFFVEGNSTLFVGGEIDYAIPVGLGFAIGKKYTNGDNWVLELSVGVGGTMREELEEFYTRLGIFIGKRF